MPTYIRAKHIRIQPIEANANNLLLSNKIGMDKPAKPAAVLEGKEESVGI